MIIHQLPEKTFARLAAGEGGQAAVGGLRQAQQPVLFVVHACLGVPADPLDVAGWFG